MSDSENDLLFYFMTINDGFTIKPNLETVDGMPILDQATLEFLSYFSELNESGDMVWKCLQTMSPELRVKIVEFFKRYEKDAKKLNYAIKIINDMPVEEIFFVLSRAPNSQEEDYQWYQILIAHNKAESDQELQDIIDSDMRDFDQLFSSVIKKYKMNSFGKSKKKKIIGIKPTSENGKCRFCRKGIEEGVTFRKVAHSVSEALGNKRIITADECDACNERFGENLEPHLVRYLDFYRVYFKIHGKNGVPKLKYKDGASVYHRKNEDLGENGIVVSSRDVAKNDSGFTIILKSFDKINDLKIFKTLCKMALSVVEESELDNFTHTIDWLSSNVGNKELSFNIAKLVGIAYKDHPLITLYVRKDKLDNSLPHIVMEFQLGTLVYACVIPFSKKDTKHFDIKEDFDTIRKVFSHYDLANWSFEDLSREEDKDHITTVLFDKNYRKLQVL